MCLLPRATLHSDSEHLFIKYLTLSFTAVVVYLLSLPLVTKDIPAKATQAKLKMVLMYVCKSINPEKSRQMHSKSHQSWGYHSFFQ
jgi:hypothetical protein